MEYISTFEEIAEIAAIFIGFIALTSSLASEKIKNRPLIKMTEYFMIWGAVLVLFFSLGTIALNSIGVTPPFLWKIMATLYMLGLVWMWLKSRAEMAKLSSDQRGKIKVNILVFIFFNTVMNMIISFFIISDSELVSAEGAFLFMLFTGLFVTTLLFTSIVARTYKQPNPDIE